MSQLQVLPLPHFCQLDASSIRVADPTRRALVGLLAAQPRSIGELVLHFSLNHSTITRHLDVLESSGLINREKEGERRICHLQGESLAEIQQWLNTYRRFWTGALVRLRRTTRSCQRHQDKQ